MSRKPVQISTASDTQGNTRLFVLADDGTIWKRRAWVHNDRWEVVADLPQDHDLLSYAEQDRRPAAPRPAAPISSYGRSL